MRLILTLVLLSAFLPNIAKADVFGFSLGYRFEPERIAIDLLFPLERNLQKRPRGGVFHIGANFDVESRKRQTQYNFNYFGISIPIAYQHVFKNGIGILVGGEIIYYKSQDSRLQPSRNDKNYIVSEEEIGGGVVLGTSYFFKSGVFLAFKVAAGGGSEKVIYEEIGSGSRVSRFSYASPTFAVGYMF